MTSPIQREHLDRVAAIHRDLLDLQRGSEQHAREVRERVTRISESLALLTSANHVQAADTIDSNA